MSHTIKLSETEASRLVAIVSGDLSGTIVLRRTERFGGVGEGAIFPSHWETTGEIQVNKDMLEYLLTYSPESDEEDRPTPKLDRLLAEPTPFTPAPDRKTEALERIAEHLRIANLLTVALSGQFGDSRKMREHIIESMGL